MSTDAAPDPVRDQAVYGTVNGLVQGDHNTVTMTFVGGGERTVPFLAPPRPPHALVGRADLLERVRAGLMSGRDLSLGALHGIPGVGKTALALALAYDEVLLGHFRDGVLWAGLGREPNLISVLAAWADALGAGTAGPGDPDSVQAWADLVHRAVGLRRMLLVVDDAWDAAAALCLKLGGPRCSHLLTTRIPQVALRFCDGRPVSVGELSHADATTLLARFVPDLVESEPGATDDLVRATGGLPLALTVIGGHLRMHGHGGQRRRVRAAVLRLREAEARLRLEEPDPVAYRHPSLPAGTSLSLRAAIDVSFQSMDEAARGALGALAVLPPKPASFGEEAALAVAAAPPEAVDTLVDHGMLEVAGPDRYTLHQTISDFARSRVPDPDAGGRMIDYFVRYVAQHSNDAAALDRELPNILAAIAGAVRSGPPHAVSLLAGGLFGHLDRRGLYAVADDALTHALAHDRSLTPAGRGRLLYQLGTAVDHRGDLDRAERCLIEGVDLLTATADAQAARALVALGWVRGMKGWFKEAGQVFERARAASHAAADRRTEAAALQGAGWAAGLQGEHRNCFDALGRGLDLARGAGDAALVADLLQVQGWMWHMFGDVPAAEAAFRECLRIARDIERPDRLIDALQGLGATHQRRARYREATAYLEEALAVAERLGHRERMALLCNLGATLRDLGRFAEARQRFAAGLEIAVAAGHREKVVLLRTRLGDIEARTGNHAAARDHLDQALELARELGAHERVLDVLENSCRAARLAGDLPAARRHLDAGLAELGGDTDVEYRIGFLLEAGELDLGGPQGRALPHFAEAHELAAAGDRVALAALADFGTARALHGRDGAAARAHAERAAAVLTDVGHHRAAEVRDWLDSPRPRT